MTKDTALSKLAAGEIPERYLRNIGTIGIEGQQKLLRGKVAVVGAGGLGGYVVELLARQGIGYIRIIDGDTFAPHNLNRQLLCTEKNLGENKAAAAARRVGEINSDTEAQGIGEMLTESNGRELLTGMDVVIDALDNIACRLLLGRLARELSMPLVHGAIAGFTGQVLTVLPGDRGMDRIYSDSMPQASGVERVLGNPAATPALAAALQVQETVKLLTGRGELQRNELLYFDCEFNAFEKIKI